MIDVRVSVCIPVFNRRDQILHAVRSALEQKIDGLEVIVTDNNSDDGTWESLQTVRDSRLRIFRNDSNIGMFGNFNRAASLARGDFVVFLCSDDRLQHDFLTSVLPLMQKYPNVVLLNGRGRYFMSETRCAGWAGDLLAPGLYAGASVRRAFFWALGNYGLNLFNYPSGIVIRRSALEGECAFREDLGNPADIDLYLRCLDKGDLLVSKQIGCMIFAGSAQAGTKGKRAGQHLSELTRVAEIHLDQPQDARLLRHFCHMLGAGRMHWVVRQLLAGQVHLALSAPKFGSGWTDMITASAERSLYMVLARIGIKPVRYIQRLEDSGQLVSPDGVEPSAL